MMVGMVLGSLTFFASAQENLQTNQTPSFIQDSATGVYIRAEKEIFPYDRIYDSVLGVMCYEAPNGISCLKI